MKRNFSLAILFLLLNFSVAFADLGIQSDSFRAEPTNALLGKSVTIYLTIHNSTAQDLRGVLKAYDETEQRFVGQDQPLAVIAGQDDKVFLEFTPKVVGEHALAFRLLPWEEAGDNPENNKIQKKLFVDEDTDGDGVGNTKDEDDDGDGTKDEEDAFPLDAKEWADTDKDGTGNIADEDDDNDGTPDLADALPLDEKETSDLDQDGVGDNADTDDDGDEAPDVAEPALGTDPKKFDTDGDGVGDGLDDYPLDPKKTLDSDKDGTPNENDSDDDGDGVRDGKDAFPVDPQENADADQDGVGDNADEDDDNDGLPDLKEAEIGSNPTRPDSDGDGVRDGKDAFPLDRSEDSDQDQDELGDNADPDDHNPGPIIRVQMSANEVEKGQVVTFDASRSYDPDGKTLAFKWILPEGTFRHESKITYAFQRSGNRKIELEVTDASGEMHKKTLTVHVAGIETEQLLWTIIVIILAVALVSSRKKIPPVAAPPPLEAAPENPEKKK